MTKKSKANGRLEKPKRDSDIDNLINATASMTNADIYHKTYLSRGTIARLRRRQTTYPSHMTMKGIAMAGGLKWELVKARSSRGEKA